MAQAEDICAQISFQHLSGVDDILKSDSEIRFESHVLLWKLWRMCARNAGIAVISRVRVHRVSILPFTCFCTHVLNF